MRRKISLVVLGVIISLWFLQESDPAWAKFHEKRIRFVVPWAPGGGADITARPLARFVNPYLDGKVYVENVEGATGAVGYREALKAAPDGYTLGMMVTAMMTAPYVIKDYPTYDLVDLICVMAQDMPIITTGWDSRFKTPQELISYAKANPGRLSVGIAGVGAADHLGLGAFAETLGTRFNFVPYKSSGPAQVAAAGGHVDIAASGSADSATLIQGKKLRPLVAFGTKRHPLYPEMPTARELGYDVVNYFWRAVGSPKGVPKDVRDVLVEAFKKATEEKEFKKLMDGMGMETVFYGPKEAEPWLKTQDVMFRDIAKKMGLKPE